MTSTRSDNLVKVCRYEDLTEGRPLLVTARQRKIAVVRLDGDVFALLDARPHKGGSLSQGKVSIKRKELICPLHFFRFELASGVSATNPDLCATRFPVTVDARGDVYVKIVPPPRKSASADRGGEVPT